MRFLVIALLALGVPLSAVAQEPSDVRSPGETSPPQDDSAAPSATTEDASTQADTVVLSLGGDAAEADARIARETLAAALSADGMHPLPDASVSLRIAPGRLRACTEPACAHAIGRELGVSLVAAVAAWRSDAGIGSVTIGLIVAPERAYTASADVADGDIASAVRRALDQAQGERRRALLIEGSAASSAEDEEPRVSGVAIEPATRPSERSIEEWILPAVLGAAGLGLAATAVVALLPTNCELQGASGVCLRGDRPNVGLGVTFGITGGLAIAGAILWLVVGGQPPNVGRIDVVLAPDGGGLSWQARF